MALQKQIWLSDIVEPLFADNTFAARAVDHSAFVTHRTVHVPNAGNPPAVQKNRSEYPATAERRKDSDLTYQIAEYTTDPVHLTNAEAVELSYDKRRSIVGSVSAALADKVHLDLLSAWIAGAETTTAAKVDRATVLDLARQLNLQDIPQTGRCLLLTADQYAELLRSLTDTESNAFIQSADAQAGTVGKLYGFDVYQRSGLGSDTVGALAWQQDCVSRALGATELFTDDRNPLYYGDILSALVRAGGAVIRADKKGVIAVSVGAA